MKCGILIALLNFVVFASVLVAQEQESVNRLDGEQSLADRPFRRIFIPEADLPDLPLDNLKPIDIEKLPAALERVVRRNNETTDPWVSGTHPLRSLHAVARLVGADLLSERTRIVWHENLLKASATLQGAETRERLSPWNLAIENSLDELSSQKLPSGNRIATPRRTDSDPNATASIGNSPSWLFDQTGQPLILKHQQDSWIRWSLKPKEDSKPNRLDFEAQIPKTVDGCLIVLLPPSARIDRSNVVFRKLETWEQAADRLGNWPDRNPTLGSNLAGTIESSYWLLETSGQERIAFTIELGSLSPRGQKLELPKDWGSDRLFSKQALQYSIQSTELRIVSEWEWIEAVGFSPPILLELPNGMKIRSASINDREPTINFDGNQIEVVMPEMPLASGTGPASATRNRMTAEFLVPLDHLERDAQNNAVLPSIRNVNGVVLLGNSILQDQTEGRFVGVFSERARLESSRKTSEGLRRFEFSWNLSSPRIQCELQKPNAGSEIESLVRLSTESERLVASVKLRILKSNDQSQRKIRIPSDWKLDANSLTLKQQIPTGSIGINESLNEIQIDSSKLTNAETVIDFQLYRNLESNTELDLSKLQWLSIDNHHQEHRFYLESTGSNRIYLRGRRRDWLVPEDMLTPWQRDSLPRLGKAIVLGSQNNTMPPLVADSLEESLRVPIAMKVRCSNSQWHAEYRFELSSEWRELTKIRVHLPDGLQWYYESTERAPLAANFDPSTGDWTLPLSNLSLDSEGEPLGAIVATLQAQLHNDASQNSELDLPIPGIRESSRILFHLDLTDPVIVTNPGGAEVKRDGQGRGYSYQWSEDSILGNGAELQSTGYEVLKLLHVPEKSDRGPIAVESNLDWFLDGFGDQVAMLSSKLIFPGVDNCLVAVRVPEGWKVSDCVLTNQDVATRQEFRQESADTVQVQVDQSKCTANSVLRIKLIGPKLFEPTQAGEPKFDYYGMLRFRRNENLLLRAPLIRFAEGITRQSPQQTICIWFPEQFVLASRQASLSVVDELNWPVWNWTSNVARLFGYRNRTSLNGDDRISTRVLAINHAPLGSWNRILLNNNSVETEFTLQPRQGPISTGWIVIVTALVSAGLFRHLPVCLSLLGLASWCGSIWLSPSLDYVCQQLFLGIVFGGILNHLYSVVFPEIPSNSASIRPDRSSTWELASSSLGAFLPWVLYPIGIATLSIGFVGTGFSQDPSESTSKIFDILIPVTNQGEVAGTMIYVPDDLYNLLEKEDRERRRMESAALIGASKHTLRLDSRSFGFGNADQPLTSNYEVWVSESAVGRAVRIPFASETLKLSRFSVDGVEVLSGRFSRSETEIAWFPDRPGRRSIQIESQVRLRSIDAPQYNGEVGLNEKRTGKFWEISSEILPVANAILEIETDGAWLTSVSANGRSSNPAIGRVIVQLGNKDRIEGFFQPPSSSGTRPSAMAMPSDPSPNSPDSPVMNTELLLDHDQLIARTVIEYPAAMAQAGEIEIESDSQWLPLGTQWSDATLVDIRTGSTLDRRRYALRWNPVIEKGTDANRTTPQRRSIVTTWIPIGDASLRSILFAECRDRRVRQGVLRYSRSAGALWTLDGISSWIPAINAKDRLDWPELKDSPLATNLRVPLSGGFGVLRRQIVNSNEQLSASTKVHLAFDQAVITTTIKRNGLSDRRTPLIFEIPNMVHIDNVVTPSNPLDFITWNANGKNYLQIFLDRASEAVNDILIEAKRELTDEFLKAQPFQWPEFNTQVGWTTPQTFSLSAEPCWMLYLDNANSASQAVKQGQGDAQILLQTPITPEPIRITRTASQWAGSLLLKISDSSSGRNLQLFGIQPSSEAMPWYGLEISLPNEIATSWSSQNPVFELTNIRWNHRLISVDPINRSSDFAKDTGVLFSIELTPDLNIPIDWHLLEQIEVNGQKPTDLLVAIQGRENPLAGLLNTSETPSIIGPAIEQALSIADETWNIGRLNHSGSSTVASKAERAADYSEKFAVHCQHTETLYTSQVWVERTPNSFCDGLIAWDVPGNWNCSIVQVNGRSYPFSQQSNRLVLYYPGIDPIAYVQMWYTVESDSAVPDSPQHPDQMKYPKLLRDPVNPSLSFFFNRLHEQERITASRATFRAWMEMLSNPLFAKGSSLKDPNWRGCATEFASVLWDVATVTDQGESYVDSNEYAEGVRALANLPWDDRDDYLNTVLRAKSTDLGNESEKLIVPVGKFASAESTSHYFRSPTPQRLALSILPIFAFGIIAWAWSRNRSWLQSRPWWNLIALGALWWLITGDLWIPCLATLVATLVVLDTYWMITSQFRRTGIRAPR